MLDRLVAVGLGYVALEVVQPEELGMNVGHVVPLEVVVHVDLPVRPHVVLHPLREPQVAHAHRGDALGDAVHDGSQRRTRFGQVDEHQPLPHVHVQRQESVVLPIEQVDPIEFRHAAERPVQQVGPPVVAALQGLGAPVPGGERAAAMAADVVERAQHPVRAAHHDDGTPRHGGDEVLAGPRHAPDVPHVLPGAAEHGLPVELVEPGLGVPGRWHRLRPGKGSGLQQVVGDVGEERTVERHPRDSTQRPARRNDRAAAAPARPDAGITARPPLLPLPHTCGYLAHTMQEHHIAVPRSARYYTLGSPSRGVTDVWFVCHGYGQLAAQFLEPFRVVEKPGRLVVAPEGLSRYYTDHAASTVGASWMTREDRLMEIADYVRYLDGVAGQILGQLDRRGVQRRVLGFSQGAATACRWVAMGTTRADQVILWGGGVPPDLDLTGDGRRLCSSPLILVVGDEDEVAAPEAVQREERRLAEHGIEYRLVKYAGGHRLSAEVLRRLAATGGRV